MEKEEQETLWGLRIIILLFVLTAVWYVYKLFFGAAPRYAMFSWQILSSAFLAWGLAVRINWVRIVTMVFSALSFGVAFLTMFIFVALSVRVKLKPPGLKNEMVSFTIGETITILALFAFGLWVFLYLRSPRIKQHFHKYKIPRGDQSQP